MRPAFEGPSTITHVQFASDVTVAFKQPVTEIAFHTANNPKDREKVLELFAEFAKSRNGLATYGALEEKDNVTVFIGGWLSVEVSTGQFIFRKPKLTIVVGQTFRFHY
jgi:hypothetical protein